MRTSMSFSFGSRHCLLQKSPVLYVWWFCLAVATSVATEKRNTRACYMEMIKRNVNVGTENTKLKKKRTRKDGTIKDMQKEATEKVK